LVLCRGSYIAVSGKECKEARDFRFRQVARVSLAVEEDKPPNPADVGLLCPKTVMFSADDVTNLIEQFGLAGGDLKFVWWGPCPVSSLPLPPKASGLLGRFPFANEKPNNSAHFSLDAMTSLLKATLSILLLLTLTLEAASERFGATHKFVQQWQSIQFGLTRADVHSRLGKPTSSFVRDGFRMEYWLFTTDDSRSMPPFKAYAVSYGHDGRVSYMSTPVPK
jgi:hypothetical protein